MRAAWPHLKAHGGGSIINVGSIAAMRGVEFMPQNAHSTAKGGVIALTLQLVVEGGPHGIRANVISPGMTETPNTAPLLADPPERMQKVVLDRIPLGRHGQPDGRRERRDLPGLRRVVVGQRHQPRRRRRRHRSSAEYHGQQDTHLMSHLNEFGITHLRHVDLAVPDYETQRAFYRDTWGLTEQGTDGDLSYFAAEGSPEQYVVRLRQSDEKRLDLIAFGAEDARRRRRARRAPRLHRRPAGRRARRAADRRRRLRLPLLRRRRPHHRDLRRRRDPPAPRDRGGRGHPGPHLARGDEHQRPQHDHGDFYSDVLGFKLSDTLWSEHMGEMMHFMRCNDWHHSLALAKGPHTSVHHVSFEMRGLDEYMRGTGRVMRAGIKKIWGPGRHNAGNNTFSYFLDPSGNTMEYTTELEKIETDEWHPSIYDIADPMTQDVWGTVGPDVGDHRPRLLQRPRQGRLRRPARLTWAAATARSSSSPEPRAARARRKSRALAAEGATVVATDVLDFEEFDAEGAGWDIPIVERRLDVTDAAAWASLAEWLSAEHGRVDALVNNAGVAARERLPHVSLRDQWQRTFDINVTGPLLGIQALVPLMPRGSSIVNICSVAAVCGPRRRGVHVVEVGAARAHPHRVPGARHDVRHPGQRGDARPGRHTA